MLPGSAQHLVAMQPTPAIEHALAGVSEVFSTSHAQGVRYCRGSAVSYTALGTLAKITCFSAVFFGSTVQYPKVKTYFQLSVNPGRAGRLAAGPGGVFDEALVPRVLTAPAALAVLTWFRA